MLGETHASVGNYDSGASIILLGMIEDKILYGHAVSDIPNRTNYELETLVPRTCKVLLAALFCTATLRAKSI